MLSSKRSIAKTTDRNDKRRARAAFGPDRGAGGGVAREAFSVVASPRRAAVPDAPPWVGVPVKPSQGSVAGIDRRAFLGGAGALVGLGGIALLTGCGAPEDADVEIRLRAALREIAYDGEGAKLLAGAGGMSTEIAFRTLRRDVSARRLYATAASPLLLREFVESQCGDDLRAGRTRRVQGWWVAETEVAVAVLVVA